MQIASCVSCVRALRDEDWNADVPPDQWEEQLQRRRNKAKPGEASTEPDRGQGSEATNKDGMLESMKRSLLRNLHVEIRCDVPPTSKRNQKESFAVQVYQNMCLRPWTEIESTRDTYPTKVGTELMIGTRRAL